MANICGGRLARVVGEIKRPEEVVAMNQFDIGNDKHADVSISIAVTLAAIKTSFKLQCVFEVVCFLEYS